MQTIDKAATVAEKIAEGPEGKIDNATMIQDLEAEVDRRAEESAEAANKEAATVPRPAIRPAAPTAAPTPAPAGKPPQAADAASQVGKPCPFVPAEKVEKRPKIFLWGSSGSGKTTLALQFPSPVVIDLERGTDLYGEDGGFSVVHTTNPDTVVEYVEWLRVNKHSFKTVVIDSITVYWEALQSKWSDLFLKRNKTSKGWKFEYYDFQPKDWMQMRDEYQSLMRLLLSLDMNVVVTAHAKSLYADGDFMKKIGDTFDTQKKSPYLFDAEIQMTHDPETDKHYSLVVKERGKVRKLPIKKFETSYDVFAKAFGPTINKVAEPFKVPTTSDVEELWRLCHEFGLNDSQAAARFETYGSSDPAELSAENVKVISEKLRTAIAAKAEQAKAKA